MNEKSVAVAPSESRLSELPAPELLLFMLQAYTNKYACGVLYASGNLNFYPFTGQAAENYENETAQYKEIFSSEVITRLLLEAPNNPEARGLAHRLMRMYLETATLPLQREIAAQRHDEGFWQNIREQNPRVVEFLEHNYNGPSLWERYEAFRGPFLRAEMQDTDIGEQTEVFDFIERIAGRQDARLLLKVVRLVGNFGLSREEFIRLQLGQDPADIDQEVRGIADAMQRTLDVSRGGFPFYIARQKQALDAVPDEPISKRPWQESVLESLRDLGITEEKWQQSVATTTKTISGFTAAYYPIPYLPNFIGSYPDLTKDAVWDMVCRYPVVLACAPTASRLEGERTIFHEHGHALEALLSFTHDQSTGNPPGSTLFYRPITLNEVFSLFHESRMPQTEYFIARERFLIARFAALTIHELNLWKKAFAVVNLPDDQAIESLVLYAERSYQDTLGCTLSCRVPTGRALRDYFDPTNPGIAASYAYGMLIAVSLKKAVERLDTSNERYEALTHAATATTTSETARETLEKLGVSWDNAREQLERFFS